MFLEGYYDGKCEIWDKKVHKIAENHEGKYTDSPEQKAFRGYKDRNGHKLFRREKCWYESPICGEIH